MYAVIFTARLSSDLEGYEQAVSEMRQRVALVPGFVEMESVTDADGNEVTVSYWRDLDAIAKWKRDERHRGVQAQSGRWYLDYRIRVAKIERDSGSE